MHDLVLKRVFILAGVALFIYLLYLLLPVVIPFLIAFLVAYLFSPLVDRMLRLGFPRWLAITSVFLIIVVGLVLVGSVEASRLAVINFTALCPYNTFHREHTNFLIATSQAPFRERRQF